MRKSALFVISLIIIVFVATIVLAGDAAGTGKNSYIKFYDYEEGLKKAESDSLHVAIFFKTTWCKYCKVMDSTTMQDQRIIDLINQHFIAVKVDGDKRRDLSRSFGVKGYPETWFLESNGKRIAPAPGFWPADDFYLLLKYIGEDAYQQEEFQKWAEKQKNNKG